MTTFASLKSNCPVCSGVRRDCRQNRQTELVHCRHDVLAPGFRFVGVDALGFNMWAADDGQERDSSEWEAQRRQRAAERDERLALERKRYAQALNADERDRNIKRIHAQVGICSRHRQGLRDRGLTDAQIDAGKFFSIDPWQEVIGINSRLAGADVYGSKLLIAQSGFACPVYNVQGRLIGWQTRFDDATNGKYKWATSQTKNRPNGATAHLPNGELPISCCRPLDGVSRNSIGLAEGFLKPYIAAQRLGQVAIGAAGGNFVASKEQLKAYLDELSSELDTKTIVLYPDGGAVANNAVMRHYEQAIQMISQWGYSVQVAWWGQETKEQSDIDELTSFDEIAHLTPEEFLELGAPGASAHSFTGLFGILPRLKRHFEKQRRSPWGFGRKDEIEASPLLSKAEILKYDRGDRHNIWQTAAALGYRHILDTSITGTGKSFDAGNLTPELFDTRQVIYISKEHRNPTTPTLKDWHDLEARHKGLYRDEFGRLRRVDKEQSYVVPPNCGRNEAIAALRSKNIAGADTAELVCTTCPYLEPCRAGKVYGFLNQRAEALKQPRLRAHPDSLPDPADYDYRFVTLVWEEASEILKAHRSTEVRVEDVARTIADLVTKLPEAFDALGPLLTTLHLYISGNVKQPDKYGWGDTQIRQALPQLGDINIDAIKAALTPKPTSIFNTTQEYGVDVANLPRSLRKKFTSSDRTTAERIAKELALDWLPDFLNVLLGNVIGSLRIQYGVLKMTLGDKRLCEIANAASSNIYLDATAAPEDIARPLRLCDDKQLLVTQQATQQVNNLEVIQVTTLGRLGLAQRSEYCQKRVDAVIAQVKQQATGDVAMIDFKRHTQSGDGKRHWWTDSRGVNDLEDCQTLILLGTPCPNLAELEAEFTVSYNRSPGEKTEKIRYPIQTTEQPPDELQPYFEMEVSADPQFREFVRRRILATIHQAIGRLRAHRRPGQSLKVYIVADYPLDIPVNLVRAAAIAPEAATKIERFETALKAGISQLKEAGQKITQPALAAVTGYSQQYISRFKNLLLLLLDSLNSKSSRNGEPPPDPDEVNGISQELLPTLAQLPPDELLNGVMDVFDVCGRTIFRQVWDATAAVVQNKILKVLLLTLPADELQALELALEGCF